MRAVVKVYNVAYDTLVLRITVDPAVAALPVADRRIAFGLRPLSGAGTMTFDAVLERAGSYEVRVLDGSGRLAWEYSGVSEGPGHYRIRGPSSRPGWYAVELRQGEQFARRRLMHMR